MRAYPQKGGQSVVTKIKLNANALKKLGERAVKQYAAEHRHECAYCHKRMQPPANLPPDSLPVCGKCAKAHGLV